MIYFSDRINRVGRMEVIDSPPLIYPVHPVHPVY
jgi:hypothetical protein